MNAPSPRAPRPPLVTLDRIAVREADRELFAGTSWTLRQGEHWALLGPSGAGKSVLAAALCGQVPLARGTIRYHFLDGAEARDARWGWFARGSVVRVAGEDRQRLADRYSPYQQARWNASEAGTGDTVRALLSRQSVEALNPYEVLPPARDEGAYEARVARTIALFGLAPLLGRRVLQLSNGETQKLLLARAVLRAPRLLVLDDPLAGLDAQARGQVRAALDELAGGGMHLVVATPRPEDLPACVDRVLLLRDHRVAAQGSRRALARARSRPPAEETARVAARRSPRARRAQGRTAGAAPAASAPLVELRGVTVRYGTTTILDRVTFTMRRGEHWALSGPNGAGKSTLLSLVLADNPQAYANRVRLFGRRRGSGESIWEVKARIGAVSPELHAHYPAGTRVLEAVCSGLDGTLGLYRACNDDEAARARGWLARFGLSGAEERNLVELSFGAQRLVLVARALVGDPELLVLDEPCQGLDAEGRRRVVAAVDAAAAAARAGVLFVTHRPDELPRCITHALQLEGGRVVRAGPR
ncbi:MAG TPA: ATP-binding cassette domain-containing protein [Anaeromyxobacter sp.]|nr:ATP-binding cassette domain-containing protein [Anaeromyxobacter sp.]